MGTAIYIGLGIILAFIVINAIKLLLEGDVVGRSVGAFILIGFGVLVAQYAC